MDELDQLIESALDEPTASEEPDTDELTPTGEEATEPVAEGEALSADPDDPEGDPDAEDPDPSPDNEPGGTEDSEPEAGDQEPAVPEDQPDVEKLRQENELAKRLLQNLAIAQQQAKQREAAEAAESERQARIEALKAQWAEMDEEEAARSQAAFIAQEATQQIQTLQAELQRMAAEREAERTARQEAESKEQVIPLILDKFGLKPEDRRFIERLNDPYAMEEVAKDLKDLRRQQTASARQVKAEKVRGNPALSTAAPQSGPAPERPRKAIEDYQDVDEYLDDLLG